ncbi:unnamed protein product [Paramecium pentaurelia]|uniref:Uncharacterized protein n=1 Tax=Paramecium pentaurelia TaxID=43138 RepID=A0A8S1V495_9CILI|nr:unnamed protein product [Paramecium pentaurelia]
MKNTQSQNKLLISKRTRTTLTLNQETNQSQNQTRKSSIQVINFNQQDVNQNQDKIYCSTQQSSPKKHRNTKSLCDTLIKSTSQKSIKTSQKDIQENNIIKEGTLYRKISPKVIFQDDKINVYFVKEINKLIQSSDTKISSQDICNREQTIQEISNPRVSIKGPITSSQNLSQARITQGILSDPKHLFAISNKKIKLDKNESLNTSIKSSLCKLLKQYH